MNTKQISSVDKNIKIENLLMAAIVSYHVVQFFFALWSGKLFNTLGGDYLSFWSSGHISNTRGYISIYDLDSQASIQGQYAPIETTGVVPTPLFPIFILPFQIMALVPPGAGFLIWSVLNIVGLFLYLKKRLLSNLPMSYLWLSMLAMPFFLNIYYGQVEVWLMIFVSEFLIAWSQGKLFQSGVWLGLALLNPQTLILIIPYLIMKRYWKILAGFITTFLFILLSTLILIGIKGLIEIMKLWLGYSAGLPSNAPEVMMNWRMLGLHISKNVLPVAGASVIVLGSAITLLLCVPLFRTKMQQNSSVPVISLFGIFAATLALTWHSHQHMSMILIPFFFKLLQENLLSRRLYKAWVFVPILAYVSVIPIVVLTSLGILPMLDAFGSLMTGTCMLIFNVFFLYMAQNKIQTPY